MDPNLWICELSAAQITSCSLSYYCHSTLHITGSFASLDLDFFPLTWYQKLVMKGKCNFSVFKSSQIVKKKTSVTRKNKNPTQ